MCSKSLELKFYINLFNWLNQNLYIKENGERNIRERAQYSINHI